MTSGSNIYHGDESGEGLILLYHRIVDQRFDPLLLAVSPRYFDSQLEWISHHRVPMSLSDLVTRSRNGELPPGAIALTFDDGYADNLLNALPLLEKWSVPATVFVSSGYMGTEFWWDRLERLVFRASHPPARLTIESEETTFDVEFEDDSCAQDDTWNITRDDDPTARHATYRALFAALRVMDHDRRQRFLGALGERLEVGSANSMDFALSREQLGTLAASPFIEIGAHTVTHPVLAELDDIVMAREILESKRVIERAIGSPIEAFAYPYGTKHDFDDRAVRRVKAGGFRFACANFPDVVSAGARPFQLPRVIVREVTPMELARQIGGVSVAG